RGEHAERRHRRRADGVRSEHDEPAIAAVADDAADEQEQHRGDGHPDPDDRKCRGRVPERVALPGDRDKEDPVAEQRHAHAGPEDAEVAVPQRAEQAAARETSRAVERLVARLHWTPTIPRTATTWRRRPGSRTVRPGPSGGRTGSPVRSRSRARSATAPAR